MYIRRYRPPDCGALADLFRETVHSVNARDYSPEQLAAWAPGTADLDAWDRSFREHCTLVAVEDGVIVGFGDLGPSGYLDRLYVHKDFQRRGAASALCAALEGAVEAERIVTHASITARPFFEGRGYRVVRERRVVRHGVPLTNYRMERRRPAQNACYTAENAVAPQGETE